MVSTTMLSSAPQLEEIATSYFSSMAPRSPYKGNNSFKDTFNMDSPGGHFGLKIKYVSQQNNQLLNCCALFVY